MTVLSSPIAIMMLALGCGCVAAQDADNADTARDGVVAVAMLVVFDIGLQCAALDATTCAANTGVCLDCDDTANAAACVDEDGAAQSGCEIAPSFWEAVYSDDGPATYTSASCGLKGTSETCVVPNTDDETGEEGPSDCGWSDADGVCTPSAAFSATMEAAFAALLFGGGGVDCTAEPDACTCSAQDVNLLLAESAEGLSDGCMACVISAEGDGNALTACMTSGIECPASGCVCSPSDTAAIMDASEDDDDETENASLTSDVENDDDGGGDSGAFPDVEMPCRKCMSDVAMHARAQGEDVNSASYMPCMSSDPCLATDQENFDEILACAGNDPNGDLPPTACGVTKYLTTSSTCQTCVSVTSFGLGFDGEDGAELTDEIFGAIRAACEPPEPEEVTVTAAITLDVGFDEIGSDPTAESYTTFVADFSADMATLLGVNEDDITVNSIVAGSVIVDFTVESTTAFVNAETVSGAFSNTGVEIAGARTTSTIAMDDITVVTPLTPDAPSKVSAAVQHNVAATPIVALAAAAVAFVA